jgi:hypothetical protein
MRLKGARGVGMIAVGALLGLGAVLSACGGGSSQQVSCQPTLYPHFTPGTGPAGYTMGIRVNKDTEVDELGRILGDRITQQDVFVINAEYPGTKPADWEAALTRLDEKFPCNRVVTLTGLGRRANAPSYEYALVGHPELDAVLVDWEPDSWADTGRGPWSSALDRNLARIAVQLRELSDRLKSTKTVMGLVPDYVPRWDYGRTARVVAEANYFLDPIHRGIQIIQTQPNCGTASAAGPLIGPLTGQLIRQYRGVFGLPLRVGAPKDQPPDMDRDLLQHVGFEVAFDESPNPKASEAVERIGPQRAAACTDQILKAGGAGVLYWASPESIRAMLDTPLGNTLRSHLASAQRAYSGSS